MNRLATRLPFFYGWAVLFAAGSSMLVRNSAASLTLAVFLYPMSEDLGWSRTLIAGAASLGGLLATVASPVVGWALDRYGARVILTGSVVVLGIATVSLAWATVPIAFYLAYATCRVLFSSPLNIGSSVVVSRWFVRRRGRATGILFSSHSMGMITFPLVATGHQVPGLGGCLDCVGGVGLGVGLGTGLHADFGRAPSLSAYGPMETRRRD